MIKWIGQHIWDFVSRFRNDVYLENIADGTVENDKFLGLDSTGKIVKETVSAGTVDLASGVTGTLPVGNGGTGATTLTDNSVLIGNGTSAIQASPTLVYSEIANTLLMTSSLSQFPNFTLSSSNDGATGPIITFNNSESGEDDDVLGSIIWQGEDANGGVENYAKIFGSIADASSTAEGGKLTFQVASHDGEDQPGLIIVDGDAEDEVDVTIGNGTLSTTTIAGKLDITRDFTLDSVAINEIQTSAESFADNDTSLMTSAAIDDRINAAAGGVTADPFSTTVIKVLPNQWVINDDAGRPLFVEDDTSNTLGVRCFGTTDEMYAWQKLPSGYKATHVQVHASASTSSAVSVRSYNYQTGADNAVSATTGDLNSNIDITDIPSSATQDLVIKVSPASGSTIIYGATVTIATI